MENAEYSHSVSLNRDKCVGCTSCLKRCPTEAIRIRNGKAQINASRCIDCGECVRHCTNNAKKAVCPCGKAVLPFFTLRLSNCVSKFLLPSVKQIVSRNYFLPGRFFYLLKKLQSKKYKIR